MSVRVLIDRRFKLAAFFTCLLSPGVSSVHGQGFPDPCAMPVTTNCVAATLDQNSYLSCKNSTFDLPIPDEFKSAGGKLDVVLTAKFSPHQFCHIAGITKVQTATYCYRLPGQPDNAPPANNLVGPVIRVKANDKLRITINNQLSADFCKIPVPVIAYDFPHDFCVTNLHTHGLHISPKDPSDNVFRSIYPNESHTYEYDIPQDHVAGTFWYHPHQHGSVAMQLTGGMAGALIVEGDLDGCPKDEKTNCKIAERVMVLQQIHVTQVDKNGNLTPDPYEVYDKWAFIPQVPTPTTLPLPPPGKDCAGNDPVNNAPAPVAPYAMINGQYAPKIKIAANEIQRWRFVHAGNDEGFNLAIVKDPCCLNSPKLPMYEIAVDGLPRGKKVQKQSNILYPGYRSDVLFQAPDGTADQIYYLINDTLTTAQSLKGTGPTPRQCLAKICVTGKAPADSCKDLPSDQSISEHTPGDLKGVIPDYEIGNRRWMLKFDYPDNKPPVTTTPLMPTFLINSNEFDGHRIDRVLRIGTAEEWRLETGPTGQNNAAGHPFHIHVNPFQQIISGVSTLPLVASDGTRATLSTKLTDLNFNSSTPSTFAVGDVITIQGTLCSRIGFSSSTTVDGMKTVGQLVDDLNTEMKTVCGFEAKLNEHGRIVVETNSCGLALTTTTAPTSANDQRLPWKQGIVNYVWRDTLLVPSGGSETVRMRIRDFTGKTVLHCHIVDHEDQGMMKNILILGEKDEMPAEAAIQGKLNPVAVQAPALKLPATNGELRDLAEFRDQNVVLVFFRGIECFHCAKQLRDLVRDVREAKGLDAEIVAVSSARIAEPAAALEALGVAQSDRFQFVVSEDHLAFRDFGCVVGDEPQHGLFVIDRNGVVRAKYTGESPFEDTQEVIRRVKSLDRKISQSAR